jgi:hypothetical protein
VGPFFVIFWTYYLHIGNRLPYREFAGNALKKRTMEVVGVDAAFSVRCAEREMCCLFC